MPIPVALVHDAGGTESGSEYIGSTQLMSEILFCSLKSIKKLSPIDQHQKFMKQNFQSKNLK